jgi:NTE family protein
MIQANIAVRRLRDEPPHHLIVPLVSDIGVFDFHRALEAIQASRAAARAVLPDLLAAIDRADSATRFLGPVVMGSARRLQCTAAERAAA